MTGNVNQNPSIFIVGRTLTFSSDINPASVGRAISMIEELVKEDDSREENLKTFKRSPIKLIINSPGGSVYDLLALIDFIKSIKTPVHGYAYGSIMSAALFLLAVCDKRYAGPHTRFMYHEISFGVNDYASYVKDRSAHIDKLEKIMDDILIANSKLNKKSLAEFKKKANEVYFDSKEALEYGFIDEILQPVDKNPNKTETTE